MPALDQIKAALDAAFPGAVVEMLPQPAAAGGSLVVNPASARAVAQALRDLPEFAFDFCSSVSGVDYPDKVEKTKVKVRKVVDGAEKEVEETIERAIPGCLEAVYFLFSTTQKTGPVVLRQRTRNRGDDCAVASLTPVWRSCEFQEREAFDLFGIRFDGHPDLRRILMWDGFVDHPMRKDYVEPDDFEYEPTPHDEVFERAREHYPAAKEGAS
jgi:NADH-quinone oxidoreductase subunit C